MNEKDWEPTEWWRVIDMEGEIWAETSDKEDAIVRMRPGDSLEQRFKCVYHEWRTVEACLNQPEQKT